MSDLPVDTTAPEAATTSPTNDQTVQPEPVGATDKEATMTEAEKKAVEDAPINSEAKVEKDGEAATLKKHEGSNHQHAKRENHSKYDPSVLSQDDDPKKICAQVEFYFSDSNLPQDKNLWTLTDGTSNKPVPIKEIHKFGRMRRFQPYEAVVTALRGSKYLDVVGIEGEEGIQRKAPYDPSTRFSSGVEARSVYAKGFGDEEPSSQFDIEAFFAPYGPTRAVRLRRSAEDKLFKGSVFVEFQDEETAQKFMELDPKPLWKGKEELKYMTKAAYCEMKIEDIRDGKVEPAVQRSFRGRGRGNRGGDRGGRGRGGFKDRRDDKNGDNDRAGDRDPNDWKKRREEDRASGFKNDRRGGRGRGRGGRGRGGRDHKNDRNRERDGDKDNNETKAEAKSEGNNDAAPVKTEQSSPNGKKRSRDEEGAPSEAPAPKKIDIKPEVTPAAAS
ncbi:hypothetical protein HYALB_00001415 [Hymenoscyphus albidus]|uniref:La domain-containing protein n=1 Tax=Hymenoscyphus albidus TaxID=595503 RepID=A0A9N9Q129_9HELO|nr:hypothetical protein HYALB_00001415 [Hymenoscyphus albidus]